MSFRAAAVQMRTGTDPARNAVAFEALVREAAGQGAVYVQSPEMTGILVRSRNELRARIGNENSDLLVRKAASLAAELGIHLHLGSTAIALDDGRIANRAFLFAPDGGLIATYDKIHMFDVDLDNGESWRESATYAPGGRTVVASLPFAAWEIGAGNAIWPDATGWALAAFTAIFPSILSQTFYIRGVSLIGSNRAGLFINLVPIFGTVLAILFLGEAFHSYHAIAIVLVLGGIWIAEHSGRKMAAG